MLDDEHAYVEVGTVEAVRSKGVVLVEGDGVTIAVFFDGNQIAAVDNRCPHMGFPLHRGSLHDGILTCHWHHARFDLASGCAFDLFADDVPSYEVRIIDGRVLVSRYPRHRADAAFYGWRLQRGLEIGLGLVQAKALLGLIDLGENPLSIIKTIAEFAGRRLSRWGEGLVRLTCVANLVSFLTDETCFLALCYATRQIATEAAGAVPHPLRGALEGGERQFAQLSHWLRTFVSSRHADGIERTLATALRSLDKREAAGLLSEAASQRLYAEGGHLLDSCNKAFELMEYVGMDDAETHVALLAGRVAAARGEEEGSSWRHPVDLVGMAKDLEFNLPKLLEERENRPTTDENANETQIREVASRLLPVLLGDDGPAVLRVIRDGLADGIPPTTVSTVIAYAAGLRLARFSSSNDVGDWFSVQHTFIFANAVDCTARRNPTDRTVTAIVQAALAVHADRFLNVPPAKLPGEQDVLDDLPTDSQELLTRLLDAMDRRSQPGEADALAVRYLRVGGSVDRLIDTLMFMIVREDLDFHCLQVLDAAVVQGRNWGNSLEFEHLIVGVVRNLAAYCPTRRAGLSTAVIARRLHRGQELYAEEEASSKKR